MVNHVFGSFRDIRIPPESTGPRVHNLIRYALHIENANFTPIVGNTVVGDTSTASATVINVRATVNPNTWNISVHLNDDSPVLEWTDGESLTFNGGGSTADLVSSEKIYSSAIVQVGSNNPFQGQFVDAQGSAYVRFTEGSQQLDAFGLSRYTTPTLLTEYTFEYNDDGDRFTDFISGSGNVTHLPAESSMRLQVGTDSGALARRTSDIYHPYQAGFGQITLMTASMGDTGKTNVRRRWGYYDDNDGLFFQLDGTTLSVVERSSTSGSVVDTVITQSNWNVDRVDGTRGAFNISNMDLDVSKNNIYWIDFEWLGAGRVRFGVFSPNGTRITCHRIENANSLVVPYMRTANLPITFSIENTGITGSTSEMKFTCASVMTDGNVIEDRRRNTIKRAYDLIGESVPNTESPLLGLRGALTLDGGAVNRKIAIPEVFTIRVEGEPIILRFYKDNTWSGGTWTVPQTNSALEVLADATSVSGGIHMLSWILEPGSYTFDMPANFGLQGENIRILADGTHGSEWGFTAQSLTANPATVTFSLSWIDIGG